MEVSPRQQRGSNCGCFLWSEKYNNGVTLLSADFIDLFNHCNCVKSVTLVRRTSPDERLTKEERVPGGEWEIWERLGDLPKPCRMDDKPGDNGVEEELILLECLMYEFRSFVTSYSSQHPFLVPALPLFVHPRPLPLRSFIKPLLSSPLPLNPPHLVHLLSLSLPIVAVLTLPLLPSPFTITSILPLLPPPNFYLFFFIHRCLFLSHCAHSQRPPTLRLICLSQWRGVWQACCRKIARLNASGRRRRVKGWSGISWWKTGWHHAGMKGGSDWVGGI